MSVINQVCGTESTKPKNMGGKKQCIEGAVKTLILATDAFAFATIAAMKEIANYDTGIESKGLVPFPNIEGIELANTDPIVKNGRYTDYTLKNGIAGVAYRFDLAICTYEALKSYANSGYTRVFEITEAEEVTCDVQEDGTVKGRKMSSFLVGLRNQATDDDTAFANVNIKFESDVYDIIRADFPASEIEGVYDLAFTVVGVPTATELVVKANVACTGDLVSSLVLADWQFIKDAGLAVEPITASTFDPVSGNYTLTAAAFDTGTISTDGVITQTNIRYEGEPKKVTIA